jgi:hypothetical protein
MSDKPTAPLNPNGPDCDVQPKLPLKEMSVPNEVRCGFPQGTICRIYRLGECSVIVTLDNGRDWHLSIAHRERYPTWDEIAQARYRCLPDGVWMAMYFPPREHYVNTDRYCFQMKQCKPVEDE